MIDRWYIQICAYDMGQSVAQTQNALEGTTGAPGGLFERYTIIIPPTPAILSRFLYLLVGIRNVVITNLQIDLCPFKRIISYSTSCIIGIHLI